MMPNPTSAWRRISIHSPSSSAPGLCSNAEATPILQMSCSSAPTALASRYGFSGTRPQQHRMWHHPAEAGVPERERVDVLVESNYECEQTHVDDVHGGAGAEAAQQQPERLRAATAGERQRCCAGGEPGQREAARIE